LNIDLDVQRASTLASLPEDLDINSWADQALNIACQTQHHEMDDIRDSLIKSGKAQLTIRLVDEAEGITLNETYRHRTGSTNVLSFPVESMPMITPPLLGDIIICAPVVEKEATSQNKMLTHHWAHLVIHGVLHLLGFDHEDEAQAQTMESLEQTIMEKLAYPDPYRDDTIHSIDTHSAHG